MRVMWLCKASGPKLRRDGLCAGSGLFLGNSMPIRDMDMYGACRSSSLTEPTAAPQASLLQSQATASSCFYCPRFKKLQIALKLLK